jgi:general secretion pathway protein L
MAKKAKTKPDLQPGRVRDSAARFDLLLPRDWPQTDAPIHWRWRPRSAEQQSGSGALDALPQVGATPVYVWTPATETLLTHTNLPTSSRAKLAQALPYALEDQLLDDPANLHFAWRREDDGTLFVAVTAKERIRAWLTALQRAGLHPTALCPATLLVPWSPRCWSALISDDEIVVRTGAVSGFTCPAAIEQPPPLLVGNLQDAKQRAAAPEYFIVFKPPATFRADAWSAALAVPVRVEPSSLWDTPGDTLPALNLLQGDFATRSDTRQQLRPLLPAALMLGLWILGTLAFDTIEWWQLKQRHNAITREMASLLQGAFPEIKNPDYEPMKQMQGNLERLQARSGMRAHDMLPLLARATPALKGESQARLRGLRYSERSLTFDVAAPDAGALERVRQALQTNGLQAETLSTSARANEVDGKIRVKPAATVSSTKP